MKGKVLLFGFVFLLASCGNQESQEANVGQEIRESKENTNQSYDSNVDDTSDTGFARQVPLDQLKYEDPTDYGIAKEQDGDAERYLENKDIADKIYEDISNESDEITIDGISASPQTSLTEFMELFGLKKSSPIKSFFNSKNYVKTPNSSEMIVDGADGAGIISITFEDKPDLTLPYGINMDDDINSAREKLKDGRDLTEPNEDVEHLDFAAADKTFRIIFADDGKINKLEIRDQIDSLTRGNILTGLYIDRDREKDEGSFFIEGKELTYPMTLKDLKDTLGGQYEEVNQSNKAEFSNAGNIGDFHSVDYILLKTANHNYLVAYKYLSTEDEYSEEKEDALWVKNIGFVDISPFSLKNEEIEINNDNIDNVEDYLIENDVFYNIELGVIQVYIYDNVKLLINEDLVKIEESNMENRIYDEAKMMKFVDQNAFMYKGFN